MIDIHSKKCAVLNHYSIRISLCQQKTIYFKVQKARIEYTPYVLYLLFNRLLQR